MDKRQLHHLWKQLRPINPWYFLIAAILCGAVSVTSLRQNNLNMLRLRSAVYTADEQNGDVETALRRLRGYVYGHMNTDLANGKDAIRPPIQLKHRYERLVAAEKKRISEQNTKIYTDAQADCERRFPQGFFGGGRIPCIQEYVASHGLKEEPISDGLYKFDFVSPRWSPDLAGLSMLASGLFGVVFALRFVSDRWLRHQLRE